ncbi:Uncharacterised protein [Salmonella enterica subsp. enterica]|uniref:Uncharacterized protein n=1 Tax=Salmonella enterica I TaxID=59201 RepID=A0A3S4IG45_SALET|nr:Uncharacterised protein [Salmonella enterica subsp. enterica]
MLSATSLASSSGLRTSAMLICAGNASDIRYDLTQFFYVFTFFTDNDTRASGVNSHTDALSRTLDNDTRYRRFSQFLRQVLTYFKIAVQVVSEFFGGSQTR